MVIKPYNVIKPNQTIWVRRVEPWNARTQEVLMKEIVEEVSWSISSHWSRDEKAREASSWHREVKQSLMDIYIYICVCVCVWVCKFLRWSLILLLRIFGLLTSSLLL